MKKSVFFLCVWIMAAMGMQAQVSPEAFRIWHGGKFSMFIHFGLYSIPGGVWDGKPVAQGYSEQIQAFAPVPEEQYAALAGGFDPKGFDADSIVALAKRAGMKSVVFTSKHHDGFCMFRTATTDYNSYDSTPCKRDFVQELADACRRGGLRFGLYYSLIDWHFPGASPMSAHNADFIPPAHHEYTKAQLRELLTNYGTISELWFDMGSNTPVQSEELYRLVHELQPDCMVSGRLGNDAYDFCVMADNASPENSLQAAWQSAASMFDETWGYRSWQERGDAETKAREKLADMVSVVSHGGNYLLNIGPKGDGTVVPFEESVLESMGEWLKRYGYAVYGAEASPFSRTFDWGVVTRKGNCLYLFSTGKYPEDGKITLQMPGYTLLRGDGKMATYLQYGDDIELTVPASAYKDKIIHVLTLEFDREVKPLPAEPVRAMTLTAHNATPAYSYSCFDYYSNYRSTVEYAWNFEQVMLKQLEFVYTSQERGKTVELTVDGREYLVTLDQGKKETLKQLPLAEVKWGERYVCRDGSGVFDAPSTLHTDLQHPPVRGGRWEPTDKERDEFPCGILSSCFVMQKVYASRAQRVVMEVGAGNGIEVFLNGKSVMKHLNPYRTTFRTETVILPLSKGENQIVLRSYNRFEGKNGYLLRPAAEQAVYRQDFILPDAFTGKNHTLTVRQHGLRSPHADTELSNLRIRLRRVAL